MQSFESRKVFTDKVNDFLHSITIGFSVIHFLFFIIFCSERIAILGIYELCSSIFYMVLYIYTLYDIGKTKKYTVFALTSTIIELTLHMCLASILVGKDFGFLHYVYIVLVFILIDNYVDGNQCKTTVLLFITSGVTIGVQLWFLFNESIYICTDMLAKLFIFLNPIGVVLLSMIYAMSFCRLIVSTEKNIGYLATHDKLTGLYNRTYLENIEFNDVMCVAIVDIDDFKRVNDTYGHDVGDDVLRKLSSILSLVARGNTGLQIMRWGGEEFVLVYNGERNFLDILTDLQQDILQASVPTESGKVVSFHVTVGVAHGSEGYDLEELIKISDNRLYIGKRTGKNKIVYKG